MQIFSSECPVVQCPSMPYVNAQSTCRGFSAILAAILITGLVKEAIDASRLGWHHTSLQAKVQPADFQQSWCLLAQPYLGCVICVVAKELAPDLTLLLDLSTTA